MFNAYLGQWALEVKSRDLRLRRRSGLHGRIVRAHRRVGHVRRGIGGSIGRLDWDARNHLLAMSLILNVAHGGCRVEVVVLS